MSANLKEFFTVFTYVLQMLFGRKDDIISDEGKKILNNPEDSKRVAEAMEELKSGKKEVTVKTDTVGTITLLNSY